MEPGIHLRDKPVGVTSHSVVRAAMEEMNTGPGRPWPLCHGGTLDPFAEGLLLLLVGPATRLMDHLHAAPKEYVATVVWGRETDNGDLLGKSTFDGPTGHLTEKQLSAALAPLLGWQPQIPPSTSAKKVDGEPAYRRVHRGEDVSLPPSQVFLHEARWLSHDLPHSSRLWLRCRGGYYVRSLARDLGRALGCGAHLSALERTAIGPWKRPSPGSTSAPIRGAQLMPWLPERALRDHELGALRQGLGIPAATLRSPDQPVPAGFPTPPGIRATHQGRLVALLQPHNDLLTPTVILGRGL